MEKYLYKDLYELEGKHWWHIAKRKTVRHALRIFKPKNKQLKLLDIGCGTGKNLEELQPFGDVFGLDSSTEAIAFCKKRGLTNIQKGLSNKSGFKTNSFDAILLLDVLEHVEEKATLREIHKILKKSGLLIITVPALMLLWSKWDEVLHHKRRYTKKSLTKVLIENGFQIKKISYLYSFLFLPVLLVRFFKSFISQEYYPSDFKLSNPILNFFLAVLATAERKIVFSQTIPLGTSILCVAKKRNDS